MARPPRRPGKGDKLTSMDTVSPSPATITQAMTAIVAAARKGPIPPGAENFGFDNAFFQDVEPLLEFLWSRYFRVELQGAENVPQTGSALLVGNHSGGLPYDGMLLAYGVRKQSTAHRTLRPLVANFAFRSAMMGALVSRFGGVRASMQNALALVQAGELVGVFPEGLRGVGKLYRERYRLTRFGRGGFVRLAKQAGIPILPVAIVGAEEIHPIIKKSTRLAKPFGLPYIPITPTFPFLGPFGLLPLPTKWVIRIGPPMPPPDLDTDDPESLLVAAEAVRAKVDSMIADLLAHRHSIFFG